MSTYEEAPAHVIDLIHQVKQTHHKHLVAAGVRVGVLMAYGSQNSKGDTIGPAIALGGYQCAGTMHRLSHKWRVCTGWDALMMLDGDRWDEWPEQAQCALIDHELQHLEVQWERWPDEKDTTSGIPKRDAGDRPKLAIRLHDWQLGGFKATAERYGRWSFEVETTKVFYDEHGQYLLIPPNQAAQIDADRLADMMAKVANGEANLAQERELMQALHDMIPDKGQITIAQGTDHETTLTQEHKKKLAAQLKKDKPGRLKIHRDKK